MRGIVALLAAFCALLSCAADGFAGSYGVWGMGNRSCGQYVQDYAASLRGELVPTLQVEVSWVQGFLSAENAEYVIKVVAPVSKANVGKPGYDLVMGADLASMESWLNNYCSAHPLDNLNSAALAFENELLNRIHCEADSTAPGGSTCTGPWQ